LPPSISPTARKVYAAALELIRSSRDGFQPSARPLFQLNLTMPNLLKAAEELRTVAALTLADLDLLVSALDDHYTENQRIATLQSMADYHSKSRTSGTASANGNQPRGSNQMAQTDDEPQAADAKKAMECDTFRASSANGVSSGPAIDAETLDEWRREAASLGCRLVRIPAVLVACSKCLKLRQVDARAGKTLLQCFTCGEAVQINQDLRCGDEDEPNTATAYVYEEVRRYVRA
jgi:hypothetical protein